MSDIFREVDEEVRREQLKKLWAFAHLLANGDLGSIVLFGSILAWAVVDRISLKRRTDQVGLRFRSAAGRTTWSR